MPSSSNQRLGVYTFGVALALLAWDLSGLDMTLARWSGGSGGFPLHDHWLLTTWLHDAAKALAWFLVSLLCLGVWFPAGWLHALPLHRRLQFALTALMAGLVITLLKAGSSTSCPWSLADFGGVAQHLSHWTNPLRHDGGSGSCFPAGHAAAGFAFIGGYFAYRPVSPVLARRWLWASVAAGLLLGISQQLRGAHFMSHTLWSGLICWCTAWALDALLNTLDLRRVTADFGETH
ncbi:MAG: phosphatidic acid phosphatase [Rhodoferax sp.]|nr:phosphatidic acid phosphatase [Rhodoferax sp.]